MSQTYQIALFFKMCLLKVLGHSFFYNLATDHFSVKFCRCPSSDHVVLVKKVSNIYYIRLYRVSDTKNKDKSNTK
jgi:hypothetical protein